MRLHYLSAAWIPSKDANSIHVMRMCAALAELGHHVRLYGRRASGDQGSLRRLYGEFQPVEVVRLPFIGIPLLGAWQFSGAVARHSRTSGLPDHYYGRHVHSLSRVASFGVPMTLECHVPPQSGWQDAAFRRLIRCPRLMRVVAVSQALRGELLKRYPDLPDHRVIVAHDGADPPQGNLARALLPGRQDATLRVGYTGHLYPGKGMEVISAIAQIAKDIDFHVVGGGEADVAMWKARTSSGNVFFHGFVPHARVAEYVAAFDVVLAPYQCRVSVAGGAGDIGKWMSPLKVFEYMACGKPIVASDLPVLREVLRPDGN